MIRVLQVAINQGDILSTLKMIQKFVVIWHFGGVLVSFRSKLSPLSARWQQTHIEFSSSRVSRAIYLKFVIWLQSRIRLKSLEIFVTSSNSFMEIFHSPFRWLRLAFNHARGTCEVTDSVDGYQHRVSYIFQARSTFARPFLLLKCVDGSYMFGRKDVAQPTFWDFNWVIEDITHIEYCGTCSAVYRCLLVGGVSQGSRKWHR